MLETVWKTDIPHLPTPKRGKVRDIYDLGDMLLIVACDRISAYDHILRPGIPGKGRILSQLTDYWLARFAEVVPNHLIATDVEDFPSHLGGISGASRWPLGAGQESRGDPLRMRRSWLSRR